jgi:hypothetical protein
LFDHFRGGLFADRIPGLFSLSSPASRRTAGGLGLWALPADEQDVYQTLAGFILCRPGGIPGPGERFRWNGFEFEIIAIELNRIDKVLVQPIADGD